MRVPSRYGFDETITRIRTDLAGNGIRECAAAPQSSLARREEIEAFLTRKWGRELDYRLSKDLLGIPRQPLAVRFGYEWRNGDAKWLRSYGNELWEFDSNGRTRRRIASINDLALLESERLFRWPLGRRTDQHPGLSDLGL